MRRFHRTCHEDRRFRRRDEITSRSFGANVKLLELKWEDQWLPDLRELMKLVDDKTKLIVINNPHNPTGALIDKSSLGVIHQ